MEEHCDLLLNLNCAPISFRYKALVLNRLYKENKGALLILNMEMHSASMEL
jgi:hypothetical protein